MTRRRGRSTRRTTPASSSVTPGKRVFGADQPINADALFRISQKKRDQIGIVRKFAPGGHSLILEIAWYLGELRLRSFGGHTTGGFARYPLLCPDAPEIALAQRSWMALGPQGGRVRR
jgi:hypothetical protein